MISSTFYITLVFGIAMLISCGYGRFTTDQIDYYGKACNASEDDLVVVKSYKVPSTETGKCLMKCMITKLGLLNDDGSYNKTGMEAGLKKYWSEWSTEKIENINNKCYEEGGSSDVQLLVHCDGMFEQAVGSRQVNLKLTFLKGNFQEGSKFNNFNIRIMSIFDTEFFLEISQALTSLVEHIEELTEWTETRVKRTYITYFSF